MWFILSLLMLEATVEAQMTTSFPLGSCRMTGSSIPYVLQRSVAPSRPGQMCFSLQLSPNYVQDCANRNLTGPCTNMITNNSKIVFWYRHTSECGFNQTQPKKTLQMFPWNTPSNQRACRYSMYSINATKPHITGEVALFKWVYKNISRIQVDVTTSRPFKRPMDRNMDKYKLCLTYSPKLINIPWCISDKNITRYSFYDPHKSLCTAGTVALRAL